MSEHAAHPGVAAATGTMEVHAEPAAFGLVTAPMFVALSMLVVIGIILFLKVPAMIARMLDGQIANIRKQLDEASALRQEAEVLLVEAQRRHAASAGDAAAIVAHAEAEAKAMLAKAEADATDLIARREKMANDKIGAAERAARAGIQAAAANAAASVAAAVIAEKHDAAADKPMIDKAIAGLARVN